MANQLASQMASAIALALANMRSARALRVSGVAAVALIAIDLGTTILPAQQPQLSDVPLAQGGSFLLTIFLKHDESKTLDQINAQLRAQGFYKAFPPEGTQVVSWYIMMGIGQVVTLRVPAERLRDVNRVIEQTAWAATGPSSTPLTTIRASAKTPIPKRWRNDRGGVTLDITERYRGITGVPSCGRAYRSYLA